MKKIPIQSLQNPTLQALHALGGSGRNREIHDKVVELLGLTEDEIAIPHKVGQTKPTDLEYKLAWNRTWLKHYGLLENSQRGVWSLTPKGRDTREVDEKEVDRVVAEKLKSQKEAIAGNRESDAEDSDEKLPEADDDSIEGKWRETLHAVLQDMDATAFERLCQLVLRESGFIKVEVTQASHDGGIDGKGILQVNEFLSFRVVFQCKRYSGSVGPDVVQKLRGAMPGSADRGLIVTTGRFTQGAIREATHEHKSPIELVDGEELINRLKELELGVTTEMVPKTTVHPDFFANI
ncbi:MAG: restriction endonuclease [Chloroflexota bacterium]|nr:restriction endonuclease [Chloroflexota bacterium]MDE2907717.1 restriction endonuclease [Chloroflexota bacterium]